MHPADRWPDSGQEFEYLLSDGRWLARRVETGRASAWQPLGDQRDEAV